MSPSLCASDLLAFFQFLSGDYTLAYAVFSVWDSHNYPYSFTLYTCLILARSQGSSTPLKGSLL